MWKIIAINLSWDQAQEALKDGKFVKIDSWHHGTDDGPVPVVIDDKGNLILRPPTMIIMADKRGRPVSHVVGRWKPHHDEIQSKDWQALEWQDGSNKVAA